MSDYSDLRKKAEAANVPEPIDVPETCVWRDPDGPRCTAANEIGGFCFIHDEIIHRYGGDASPRGREAIRRSALHEPQPISLRRAWREARLAYIAAANPATMLGLLDDLDEARDYATDTSKHMGNLWDLLCRADSALPQDIRDDVAPGRHVADECARLLLKVARERDEARAEVARLQAGGCARDQRTTQFCAEAMDAIQTRDEACSVIHEILSDLGMPAGYGIYRPDDGDEGWGVETPNGVVLATPMEPGEEPAEVIYLSITLAIQAAKHHAETGVVLEFNGDDERSPK